MEKLNYTPPKVNYGKKRKTSRTLPNQSLSIAQIMDRFTRGVPVDVARREGVNMPDNAEHDYERMSRMDFDEKVAKATEMRDRAIARINELNAKNDELQREKAEAKKARIDKAKAEKSAKDTGIVKNP